MQYSARVHFSKVVPFWFMSVMTPISGFASTHSLRLLNNSTFPIQYRIQPGKGKLSSSCGQAGVLAPHASSCVIKISTSKGRSSGRIDFINENQKQCSVNYSFNMLKQHGHMDQYSLKMNAKDCEGWLQDGELVYPETPNAEYHSPLDKLLAVLGRTRAGLHPKNLAVANCSRLSSDGKLEANSENCLIISSKADSIKKGLALQAQIDQYEPLSKAQWMGTHNSLISGNYSASRSYANMSYSDPNNVLSVTDTLNLGARSIELDFLWDGKFQVCHDHANLPKLIRRFVRNVSCHDNSPIVQVLSEINQWVVSHPNDVVMLYLDINMPIREHGPAFSSLLAQEFGSKLLTKSDLAAIGNQLGVPMQNINLLPTQWLTKASLLQAGKQIIVTSKADVFINSDDIFTAVVNPNHLPLKLPFDMGMDHFNTILGSANGQDDFAKIFIPDTFHSSLWRFNGDRTIIAYEMSNDSDKKYNDYFTLANLRALMQFPVNMISFDMLQGTYGVHGVDPISIDPRLSLWLWSWQSGFPVSNGKAIAYIDPTTEHFKNDRLPIHQSVPYVLCYNVSKHWFVVPNAATDSLTATSMASQKCDEALAGSDFAAPTTSYAMAVALKHLHSHGITAPVLVNYQNHHGWVANDAHAL